MTTTLHQPQLRGLHHVTAVTAHAQRNLDFYTKHLGMRLVKRTVNQDDVRAYHLFYADALGSAGTDLTFFEWPDMQPARPGAGTISETALRVLGGEASLAHWVEWFDRQQVAHGPVEAVSGLPTLPFRDHEGQRLRLIAEPRPADVSEFHPWRGSPVPAEAAIVGLAEVGLCVPDVAATASLLTGVLGFRAEAEPELLATGAGGPGTRVRLSGASSAGALGAGGVHHVAWRVDSTAELLDWQRHLEAHGVTTSGKIDRHYFHSLYFRIPGKILFEIATDGPGFAADGEAVEHLGETLALPPFLEPRRAAIEAGVTPLIYEPAT